MKFLHAPPPGAATGLCYNCDRARAGVDTGIHIEAEGDLFICETCVAVMAKLCGFEVREEFLAKLRIVEESLASTTTELERVTHERNEATGKLLELKGVADTLFPPDPDERARERGTVPEPVYAGGEDID